MRDSGFTRQERSFITLMRIWAAAFLVAAVIFATLPDVLLNYLNDIGRVFAGWQSPKAVGGGQFWLVLACSLLVSLSYACLVAQAKPLRNTGYANIVILAKFVSAAGFTAMLFVDSMQFYYLVGAVVDGLIFIITWRFYARAAGSRS